MDSTIFTAARCTSGARRILLAAVLALISHAPTLAQSPGGASHSAIPRLTQSLIAISERHSRAATGERPALRQQLVEMAASRQSLLLRTIRDRPVEVLRNALPESFRAGMPAAVRELVETRTHVEGVLEIVHEDYEHASAVRYFLNAEGRRHSLHFAARPPRLQTGIRVRASGVSVADALALESGDTGIEVLALDDADPSGAGTTNAVSALPGTFGEQSTVVLLVNFQDAPGEQPYTLGDAHDLVFGDVNAFILENSYGQTWLSGEVHGWYTLPLDRPTDSADCKSSEVALHAQQAALADGVDLAAFDRYIYVFPQTPCFPSGSGTVGGSPSESWINGSWFTLRTVGHELGHNLGLYHSSSLECGDTVLDGDCQVYPYGDTLDIMGNKSVGHFNPFQKQRLGWLEPQLGDVVVADTDGIYTLQAYETLPGAGPKALKVAKGSDPATGEMTWYYIEYRQAIGFDDFLAGNANVLNGIVVRTAADSEAGSSRLLDMTPASSVYWDWDDPALPLGERYSDPQAGVTIELLAANGAWADVAVSLDPTLCVPLQPTLSVAPVDVPSAEAGQSIEYVVSVENSDGAACGGSQFDLQAGVPDGWAASYSDDVLALGPGATESALLTVTSAAGSPAGDYAVDVSAVDTAEPGRGATASTSYRVLAAANHAPVAVDDSATTLQDTPVTIDLLANDTDPDNDALTVLALTQPTSGSVSLNPDGSATFVPKHRFKGDVRFSYTVTDGATTAAAAVTVVVERNESGSKGGGKGGKPGR